MIEKIKNRLATILKWIISITEQPLLTTFIVLILVLIIVISFSLKYYVRNFDSFWEQIMVEAHGMIFDIAIIGILLFWLNQNGDKRKMIRMYNDEIDDFRTWESEESAYRTVGNIKRLNRFKIYDIDLGNCYLVNTNLNNINLTNSNVNSANLKNSSLIETNLEGARLNQTNFEMSNMNQANLKNTYANSANFQDAILIKADLQNSFLIKANFKNAFLMEANLQNTYLMGVDFSNASLYKADLRGAKGLTVKQLLKAKTLYLAKFDENIKKELETINI